MTDAPAFSVLLREATRTEHGDAENRGFITRLMGGELAEADYWRLLEQYLPIYATLEERMRLIAAVGPLAASVHDPRLERSAAIRADLAARFGEGHTPAPPLPTTERCTARLAIADTPPSSPTTTCATWGTSPGARPSARSSPGITGCPSSS